MNLPNSPVYSIDGLSFDFTHDDGERTMVKAIIQPTDPLDRTHKGLRYRSFPACMTAKDIIDGVSLGSIPGPALWDSRIDNA